MKKFSYLYANTLNTKDAKLDQLYEGERIINKSEEIKFEDDLGNVEYDTKSYITNFRIVVMSNKYIFDCPLCYIKSHWVKKPMLYGSSYIYIDFMTGIDYKTNLPVYILENLPTDELTKSNFNLPKYIMIKFRGKDSNLDQSYNLLKMALNAKEWNNHLKKIQSKEESKEIKTINTNQVSGLGIERAKNLIMSQLDEQNKVISGSFSDIQALKSNAQQMIDLAQQIKTKLNTSSQTNDPSLSEINQVLTSIGFVDPVTKEISGKSYFQDLAVQINDYFKSYFAKEEVGILSIIDAYCIYNRSRGISTISPSDMRNALKQFANIQTSILVKYFKNDMIMIHTSDYSLENLLVKLQHFTENSKDYFSLKEFSELTTKKNQLLSKILIDEMVDEGLIVIDESDYDVRFYLNKILNYKL